ncbi:MAG: aminotransferase class III-fold pyridoxal phosphate-dependent enzyme, partial [Caldisphaera sp.]|nr:aminotransferase class III-fold pyridoxal phosphate-dependent enzyme [Caldisphaera sp.]
ILSVEEIFNKLGDEIAAVIIEPVIGNMGVIKPEKEFLQGIRKITKSHNTLLIFDEVITGFRISIKGAQEYFGINADIVTLGKIIGGGFPVGAIVSSKNIMDSLTPSGNVFNAGTFNGHPITMVAGLATLETIEKTNAIKKASLAAKMLEEKINEIVKDYQINRVESMMQIFFANEPINNADDARKASKEKYTKFHEFLLSKNVFIPPSQFETIFTSSEHNDNVIDITAEKMKEAIKEIS